MKAPVLSAAVALSLVNSSGLTVDAAAKDKYSDWPRARGASYLDMPDGQYLELFGSLEPLCRKVLTAPNEHIAKLQEQHAEQQAKNVHETRYQQCLGIISTRLSIARLSGYKVVIDDALTAAFWSRLDRAKTNLQ